LDKRYQVFVSSTYEDLREERQEVMHALLELDCIPSGMELFPAADEDQWTLIQKVISECDYYLLISAGRYGSIGSSGLSYTEMEYRYAMDIGKPIIGFLHKDPTQLSVALCEQTDEGKRKLVELRSLVQKKMCKFWTSPSELGSVVSRSLVRLIKTTPSIGWIRANQAIDSVAATEILKLKKTVDDLQLQLQEARLSGPKGSEQLAQENDKISIDFKFDTRDAEGGGWGWDYEISLTWNEIFYDIGPLMLNEATDNQILAGLNRAVRERSRTKRSRDKGLKGHTALTSTFEISDHDFQTVKIQLIALGLIAKSEKPRSVKDSRTLWNLTPYGDQVLTKLRAIRKGIDLVVPEPRDDAAESE
jgi:hypothetical protein